MKKQILSMVAICSLASANEPSIFDAGNLEAKNPYGLTSVEKHILKNKQELDSVDTKIKTIKNENGELKNTVDGLVGVTSSNTDHITAMSAKIDDLSRQLELKNSEIKTLQKTIAELKYIISKNSKVQDEESKILKKLIGDLGNAVAEINKNYVSSNEFKANLEQLSVQKTQKPEPVEQKNTKSEAVKEIKKDSVVKSEVQKYELKSSRESNEVEKTSKYDDKKSQEIFIIAKNFFDKESYGDSKIGFEMLVKKNFKPAESSYYLGLISVDEKKYDEAIEYFRKSALLNEEARYMPNLLLKSAESFEKSGNNSNAKKFYKALNESYPDSKEATIAKNKLKKLK